jgi:hypothetical protein
MPWDSVLWFILRAPEEILDIMGFCPSCNRGARIFAVGITYRRIQESKAVLIGKRVRQLNHLVTAVVS